VAHAVQRRTVGSNLEATTIQVPECAAEHTYCGLEHLFGRLDQGGLGGNTFSVGTAEKSLTVGSPLGGKDCRTHVVRM
jgi:hypothetical protein